MNIMAMNVTDNLSLLASLAPLRQTQAPDTVRQDRGFSDKLDQAVSAGLSEASSAEKARALAESLTLQMLQTSLSLSDDGSTEPAQQPLIGTPLSSTSALIKAYQAGMAEPAESTLPPAVAAPAPSQLRDLSVAAAPRQDSPASAPERGTAWLDPIIDKASRRYGVDVGLIKAVIKAESNFNPRAVSHAGASGLMQLMPATARSLGVNDSFDPEQNVMAGTRFLKDLLKRYDGDVDSALAAYNWGPGNVDRKPDRLPRETRNYLVRVKQLYSSYSG